MASTSRTLIMTGLIVGLTLAGYKWNQAQHDKLEKAKAEAAQVEAALAQKRSAIKDLTGVTPAPVEVTVTPAPQDSYSRSARVAEGLVTAMRARVSMVDFRQSEGRWPLNNKEAGLASPEEFRTSRIQSLQVWPDGRIQIALARETGKPETLLLRGSMNGAGNVDWRCTSPDMEDVAKFARDCSYLPY